MKPTYSVLLVLNKTKWSDPELQAILSRIRLFFFSKVDLQFYCMHTAVENIPWVKQVVDSTATAEGYLIDRVFYDNNFTKAALAWGWRTQIPVDIMCVVLRGKDVHDGVIQGACDIAASTQGMIETWVKGDVGDKYYLPNGVGEISALECNLMHEISHSIAAYNGIFDRTHQLQDIINGNKPKKEILQYISVTPKYVYNKAGFRTLRNYFRKIWNLF